MFPQGINVLSHFSGISSVETALEKLGIPLNFVRSIDISKANRNVMTNCSDKPARDSGAHHVQKLDRKMLENYMNYYEGFDLFVVGGTPCNNLAGSNMHHSMVSIFRFLYDVHPNFVDSKYLCACVRKRGYNHNLPIEKMFALHPPPPQTISEALPLTRI